MLRIELGKTLALLAYKSGKKQPSIAAIARETGISRNTISKIVKDPTANITTEHIDKILGCILEKFEDNNDGGLDTKIVNEILSEFFTFERQ